ncbi:MAG: ABC transporter substrate-binding protein [Chloroflexi bacterium]|nr:MAG: ABC transporter substrate-binding protein [Chloroflexota bacterium]
MDREIRRRLDGYRQSGPIERTLIDELLDRRVDRREFIRRATVFGLSTSAIGTALVAAGCASSPTSTSGPKVGGRLRVGIIPPPAHDIEPHTFADQGALETGSIAGEHLIRSAANLKLVPELATSWTPNGDASVWTIKLRPNVKFQTGQVLTATDIVATYERLVSPNSGSQALSAFKGVLSPGGTTKVDDLTLKFQLDNPTASFPYLLSSTTYQSIMLPANYQLGTFTSKPQTTGAFKLTSYTPGVGAKYERYTDWWGGRPPLDGVDVTYYQDAAAVDAALLGATIDLIGQIQLATDRALFNNSKIQIFGGRGATHRQVPMRVDLANPLKDPQVRQAIALTLDRPAIVDKLFSKYADVGNDTPWGPVYPSTVGAPDVPQRQQDLTKAKQLMAAAGFSNGFSITLTTEDTGEIPQLAQIIQQSVKAINIDMKLSILTSTAYFAGSQLGPPSGWGDTPWLNAPINITDWGHRSVPNVFLTSALQTNGVWNAAHYSNPQFDAAAKAFIGAISIDDQRKYAKQAETILLQDTPVIFPYFYNYLAAGSQSVKGYYADPQGTVFLSQTSLA